MCPSAWVDKQEDILFSWLHLYIMPILLLWDLRTLCVVYQNSDPKIHFLANLGRKATPWLFSFETLLLNIQLILKLLYYFCSILQVVLKVRSPYISILSDIKMRINREWFWPEFTKKWILESELSEISVSPRYNVFQFLGKTDSFDFFSPNLPKHRFRVGLSEK